MSGSVNIAAALGGTPAPRSIEVITEEILQKKQEAGAAILRIGECLMEAKGMLTHGEWLPWLNEQVEFSERTATRFMRLAREWTNRTALSDLGATKALSLLALPPEEREQFMAEAHEVDGEEKTVIDMSARELDKAIREREEALVREKAAEEARAQMEADMKMANARLEAARQESGEAADREAALQRELEGRERAVSDLARELEALKKQPVSVAMETVVDPAALEQARAAAVAEMQEKLDKAKDARTKADEKRKEAEQALAEANRRLEEQEKSQRIAAVTADKDVAAFEVLFGQAQEQANKLRGLLLKVRGKDADTGERLSRAILALADAIRGCAE